MKHFQTDGLEEMDRFHDRFYVKDIVYRTKVRDITDLKQRISDAIATIDEDMLQRTWQEIEYRLDVLCLTNGAHIEMY